MHVDPDRLIRTDEVLRRVRISRSQLYRLMAQHQFPPSVRLSHKVAAWSAREVDAWIAARLAERRRAA